MLKATQLVCAAVHTASIDPWLKVIIKHGTLDDSKALLNSFALRKNPELLGPIMAHGDSELADELFSMAIVNGKLQEGFSVETFYALSYLGHAETQRVLMSYYTDIFDKNLEWEVQRAVCLSLLNYSCLGDEKVIAEEIEKCFSLTLFPEFIPVLASKTKRPDLAERLYEHGCTKASSDASAGLILGLALYGPAYADLLKKIIWNPEWEASSSATGNAHYTFMGMGYLGISLSDLYIDLQNALKEHRPEAGSAISTFNGLLHTALYIPEVYPVSFIPNPNISFNELYNKFFKWNNPFKDDSIIGLAKSYAKRTGKELGFAIGELSELSGAYYQRANQELELSCYTPIRIS